MNLLVKCHHHGSLPWRLNKAGLLALMAVVYLISHAVMASDLDFNAPDGGIWMSLEHFTDKADRFPELMNAIQEKLPEQEKRSFETTTEPEQKPANKGPETTKTLMTPHEEQPTRATSLPVLPGINKGFDLQVRSTEEDANKEDRPEELSLIRPVPQINPAVMPGWSPQHYDQASQSEGDEVEPEIENAEAAAAEAEAAKAAALAQTVRQINPPVMPGFTSYTVNNAATGYENEEATTMSEAEIAAAAAEAALAAEKAAKTAAMIQAVRQMSLPIMPGVGQSMMTEAVQSDESIDSGLQAAEGKQTSLNIRYAGLPGQRLTLPSSKKTAEAGDSKTTKKKPAAKGKTAVPARPTPACQALTAYRQRQLEAIESDRQTLSALQSAISELGLDQKLDFMTGASGNVGGTKPVDAQSISPKPESTTSGGMTPIPGGKAGALGN